MANSTRRALVGITSTGLGGLWVGDKARVFAQDSRPSPQLDSLYVRFRDPDRKYSMRPYWFWNGKLEADELGRQIRQMVDHGVYGAYVHSRGGLETPYLSEEWWQAVGAALKISREVGFSLCMNDDFEWPSGEARDFWLPGKNKSRVVAANPDYGMKRLFPNETAVHGPGQVEISVPANTTLVVAGRRIGSDRLDGSSLCSLRFPRGGKSLTWKAPEGDWLVTIYTLESTQTFDRSSVDLMNPEAVRKFIEIYYEELNHRHGAYLGNALPATFADQEGAYGRQIAWTPRLFETFRKTKGYDLETLLPGLTCDIGKLSEKVRCDYIDVVSELYSTSYFNQVNKWCAAHGMEHSSHMWEESLFLGPAYNGDYFKVLRAMGKPGCDAMLEWGRQPVSLKETASVADFMGRRAVCENQGLQGRDSYLSPGSLRRVSNCLAAWNMSEFISHAFNYDLSRTNYPPDWFRSQPYLPWFRTYADQMRRISFMNSESHHVADLLVYYPQVSIWGQSGPMFRGQCKRTSAGLTSIDIVLLNDHWPEDAVSTNSRYSLLKSRLSGKLLDYKIADDSFLAESHVEGNQLVVSTSRFRTVVLPPMSTMRLSSAERIAEFYRAGGTVVSMGTLPLISTEEGRDDRRLKALWDEMFDATPSFQPFTMRSSSGGGRAYLVPGRVEDVVDLLGDIVMRDLEVASGPAEHLYCLHKQKDGLDFYWLVNDSAFPRTNLLNFRVLGRPERWDAPTGKRLPLFYQTDGARTMVRLALAPWDATYVVFDPSGPAQPLALKATNLDEFTIECANGNEVIVRGQTLAKQEVAFIELSGSGKTYRGDYRPASHKPLELTGEWQVTVEGANISLPYAEVRDDPRNLGHGERWYADSGSKDWHRCWLSPLNCMIRRWNVIGPFSNPNDTGLARVYPPEQELDFGATYTGSEGRAVHWVRVDNDAEHIDPRRVDFHWPEITRVGERYVGHSNTIDYGMTLRMGERPEGIVYAQTYIHAPDSQEALVVLNSPNPKTVWLNATQVFTKWVRPIYCDPTDGFAERIQVRLDAGWNSLLLKFVHNAAEVNFTSGYWSSTAAFGCRVEGLGGKRNKDLIASHRPILASHVPAPRGSRWVRFQVPVVARALRVPDFDGGWSAFVDGNAVGAVEEISLPQGTRQVVVRVNANERLDRPFAFLSRCGPMPLGSWSIPGLEHFSGSMIYEKTVEVPSSLLAERVLLDCGQVGVCAEVWVNGTYIGAQPWEPYVFDATGSLRAGPNQLKVRIANTEANARAVGESLDILKSIDVNGWVGPACLVPYIEREIRCVPC